MWGAKTVHTVVARASIGAAVLLATLLTLLPSRVRRKWFERLGSALWTLKYFERGGSALQRQA
jgi:hypothetical protein